MDAIHFQTEVGSDNTIRVPEGITLPTGTVSVTVVASPTPDQEGTDVPSTWNWMLEMAREAEQLHHDLPSDLAANHDHYAHGKPRE
jgi:hypothetical protein